MILVRSLPNACHEGLSGLCNLIVQRLVQQNEGTYPIVSTCYCQGNMEFLVVEEKTEASGEKRSRPGRSVSGFALRRGLLSPLSLCFSALIRKQAALRFINEDKIRAAK
jgi:hypothetical protein